MARPLGARMPPHARVRRLEPLDALARALDVLVEKVSGVSASQLHDPTPCEEFDVEALLNHILIVLRMLATGAETGAAEQLEFTSGYPMRVFEGRNVAWLLGDDPVGQCADEVTRVRVAWASPAVLDTPIKWGPWATIPAPAAVAIGVRELVIHAWDVAKATGQDTTIPDEVAVPLLEGIMRHDAGMRTPTAFHAKVTIASDAPITDRLAAFAGRCP